MRRFFRYRWPKIDVYGVRSRGDIKLLTVQDLERLTMAASANPKWSANGRPEWLQEARTHIKTVMATAFGPNSDDHYRCLVAVVLDDGMKCNFILDVSIGNFDGLPNAAVEDVVSLAHRYLLNFPSLDLDPAQRESWQSWRRLRGGADDR